MQIDKSLKNGFSNISDIYEKARECYPDVLITDIIKFSGIKKTAKILDIGCGSGKTTLMFGKKGYNILGVDISQDLISVASKLCSDYKNIKFIVSSFEEADINETFDLIIAAQAWHWLDAKIAHKKVHDLLNEGRFLALFWKHQDIEKKEFLKQVEKAFQKYCPKYHRPIAVVNEEQELQNTDLFESYQKYQYTIKLEFDKERFLNLATTYSWVIVLSEEKRKLLLEDISKILVSLPAVFKVPYIYTLLITKKK